MLQDLDLKPDVIRGRATAVVAVLALLCGHAATVSAAEYYVAPNGNATNAGTQAAPWSLAKANASLRPGDTAILLSGTYTGTPIAPARSGRKGKAITYRAAGRHKAIFKNMTPLPESRGPTAVFVSGRSWITVDGIKVVDVKRWVMGVKCDHITIANCHFEKGSGWINCRFENSGDGIRLTNNYFHEGTDLVSLDGGDGHLVEGNFFGDGTHTGLVLLGVQRSVVRGNRLTNRRWRCMEVESQRHKPFRLSMHNLIEKNTFDFSPCSGIQYAGNRSILRRNVFRRCLTGMNWANYVGSNKGSKKRTPEAWHDRSNRFYNNVIAECGTNDVVLKLIAQAKAKGVPVAEKVSKAGYGMVFATNMFNPKIAGYDDCAYGDNVVVNNIFYRNANATDRSDKKGKMASRTTHVAFDWNATPEFGRFHYNAIFSGKGGAEVFYFCDAVYQKPAEPRNRSIASFQKRYPQWATNNKEGDPKFVDAGKGDYHLTPGSWCIDGGGALTTAKSAGQGTVIQVEDALFFTDGYGLIPPDVIRVGPQRVKIVKVDYDKNAITLAGKIAWQKGAPVALDYKGKAPDLGAFERE